MENTPSKKRGSQEVEHSAPEHNCVRRGESAPEWPETSHGDGRSLPKFHENISQSSIELSETGQWRNPDPSKQLLLPQAQELVVSQPAFGSRPPVDQSNTIDGDEAIESRNDETRNRESEALNESEVPNESSHHNEKHPETMSQLQKWRERLRTTWTNGWLSSVMTCILTLTTLIALIGTLRYFDGYVLTEIPLPLSLNALAAIFTAILKASLLLPVGKGISQLKWLWFSRNRKLIDFENFDLASRGPWGSILLIYHLKLRSVAVLGAFITILALAVDPFTQQIIRPVSCFQNPTGSFASVARGQNFTGHGPSPGGRRQTLSIQMREAISAGLLDSPRQVEFECSTGNCTFTDSSLHHESFQTMGVDHACVDISDTVKAVVNPLSSEWTIPQLQNDSYNVFSPFLTRTDIAYDKAVFQDYWPENSNQETNILRFAMLTETVDRTCPVEDWATLNCVHPFAVECQMWPVIQTVEARVRLGKLEETILDATPLRVTDDINHPWLHTSAKVLRNGSWQSCEPKTAVSYDYPLAIFNNSLWYTQLGGETPPEMQWYPRDCVWTIGYGLWYALRVELASYFDEKFLQFLRPIDSTYAVGPGYMHRLYANGSANLNSTEEVVKKLAQSMTAFLRTDPQRDQELGFTYGSAVKWETCVKIQWAWISFPASLVILEFVFLALTMYQTRRPRDSVSTVRQGVWASSSLAVLFTGLDPALRQEYQAVNTNREMIHQAENMRVSLVQQEEDTWKLSGTTKI